MERTYADAGVLIAGARGDHPLFERAMHILDDPEREFASSPFVRLEVLPKAMYERRRDEEQFYREFFGAVSLWANASQELVQQAEAEAAVSGLNGMDALHVAAASSLGADELVTTEGSTKTIHRTTLVSVVTIRPSA